MPSNLDDEAEALLDLPETARLNSFGQLDDLAETADVRLAWNEFGLGFQGTILGKEKDPIGDATTPKTSDGFSLWIDTRGDRTAHRASRFCHHFYLLPCGEGDDQQEPALVQSPIHRAQQDAPLASTGAILFRCHRLKTGYRIEAFFGQGSLNGYDPEQYSQLGVYFQLRDQELGDQYLGVNTDFPFAEDPSLWDVLDLVK
jgi:hypothetical protein